MTTLPITAAQAELLRAVMAEAEQAAQRRNLVFATLLRGHGLTEATLVDLTDTALTVRVDGAD